MSQFLKEYFTFTTREKRGVFLLLLIIIILVIILLVNPFNNKNKTIDAEHVKKEISALDKLILNDIKNEENINEIKAIDFDPNTVNDSVWKSMGMPEKLYKILDNFRKKGGKFKKPEDLLKIYGFSQELYEQIKNNIKIKNYEVNKHYKETYKPIDDTLIKSYGKYNKPDSIQINLNTATKDELILLPGIGETYSDRILKYRNLLGGFYSMEQLLEVYGINEELLNKISSYIVLDNNDIIKTKINTAEFNDLLKHPYLEYNQVRMICNYRKDYKIKSMNDLIRNNIIDKETAKKLEPYLDFEE
ncbi:MAG: helix-hairpin-helix domain-containing protein [Marinilabiliales bacterium]